MTPMNDLFVFSIITTLREHHIVELKQSSYLLNTGSRFIFLSLKVQK